MKVKTMGGDEEDARWQPVALLAFGGGIVVMLLIIVLATRDMWGLW